MNCRYQGKILLTLFQITHRIIVVLVLSIYALVGTSQQSQYKVACIAFYNFENLFDTEDDPEIKDEEFTPDGERLWTPQLYAEKMDNLASVVSELGIDKTLDGAAILGVAEIENRKVLEDFVIHPDVAERNYKIIHKDSPDRRGIDVALLYQEKYFTPEKSEWFPIHFLEKGDTIFSRDILYVQGTFDGETIHVFVNHWPSRSGGEKVSQAKRIHCAQTVYDKIRSIYENEEAAKIFVIGDLNDDPVSQSVKKYLRAKKTSDNLGPWDLFNPMASLYKRGIGTLAYRDAWSMFDQIIISPGAVKGSDQSYRYWQVGIHNKKHLVQKTGKYKGYPFRTFSGSNYSGGYSDHFAVYIFVIKPI